MFRATLIIEGSPQRMAKSFRGIVKDELGGLIGNWHSETLPGHFRNSAISKYGYAPRAIRYQRYKEKKHLGPLVFGGESRRMLMQTIRISGSAKKVTGSMPAPRHFFIRRPASLNKVEEVTAVTQEETLAMAATLQKKTTKKLNNVNDKTVVR